MKSPVILLCVFLITLIEFSFADCDNLQDVCPTATTTGRQTFFVNGFPCKNPVDTSAEDFKSSKLRKPGDTDNFIRSAVTLATALDFPGLNTLGLAIARIDIDVDGLVVPHSHPRATEMVFVSEGVVLVGFIDTQNNAFQTFLKKGDVFVFPQGLIHYCVNAGFDFATIYSMFNSQNPGVVTLNGAMFGHSREEINKFVRKLISNYTSEEYSIRDIVFSRFSDM